MPTWLRRIVREDDGQDVVEYALLTAFFGLAAMAAWTSIRDAIGVGYGRTTSGVQGLWDPPPPSGAGSGGTGS
jgi:Flp pilus assembly pilin Flp